MADINHTASWYLAARSGRSLVLRFMAFAIITGSALSLSGCGVAYLLHAAKGQYELISESVPVEKALEKEVLSPRGKKHLMMVEKIKTFGEKHLGLKPTDNYTTVYLKSRTNFIYTVSACPKDRLARVTWWFPIVGSVPYLGFFDLDKAKAERVELLKQDLDVVVGRADAYSTLGWFKDPVTLNLLEGSTVDLAETILHEMTHTTFYLKGQGEFNEGLAALVGKQGALQFFEEAYGPHHPLTEEARKSVEDERIFSAFLDKLLDRLEKLYCSPLTYSEKIARREKIFLQAKGDFETLKLRFQTDAHDNFEVLEINNASLLAVGLYHRYFNLFDAILEENRSSIKRTMAFFKELAKKDADMISAARAWLCRRKKRLHPGYDNLLTREDIDRCIVTHAVTDNGL
jgi:predicted aminopeptidase